MVECYIFDMCEKVVWHGIAGYDFISHFKRYVSFHEREISSLKSDTAELDKKKQL